VATAAMSVMLSMTSGAAAGLMSWRVWFHDKKPRVMCRLVSLPQPTNGMESVGGVARSTPALAQLGQESP
jgi:hypothetical protein